MIYKIKGLHDRGQRLSIRAIAREVTPPIIPAAITSPWTRPPSMWLKPIRLAPSGWTSTATTDSSAQGLPKFSAAKLARHLRDKVGAFPASEGSNCRYVHALKQKVAAGQ